MSILNLGAPSKLTQGLYVGLDALFDTRFAILEEISQTIALQALADGWAHRRSDVPKDFPKEDFDYLYKTRDLRVLELAAPTQVLEMMKFWVMDVAEQVASSPEPIDIQIFVNIHPYKLTPDQAKALGRQIQATFPGEPTVTMVNASYEELTPETCKTYFTSMFMYDYHLWAEHHAKAGNFHGHGMPDVTIWAPAIFHGGEPTEADLREFTESKRDVFKEWEFQVSPVVGLEHLPVAVFSNMLPPEYLANIDRVKPFMKPKPAPEGS